MPVTVHSDQKVKDAIAAAALNSQDLLSRLRVKGLLDPNSIRVVSAEGVASVEVPIGVEFDHEYVLDDFESGLLTRGSSPARPMTPRKERYR